MKKTRTTTVVIAAGKPRNPLVAASRFRRAGAHGARGHAERQQAERALQRELSRLHPPSP